MIQILCWIFLVEQKEKNSGDTFILVCYLIEIGEEQALAGNFNLLPAFYDKYGITNSINLFERQYVSDFFFPLIQPDVDVR